MIPPTHNFGTIPNAQSRRRNSLTPMYEGSKLLADLQLAAVLVT